MSEAERDLLPARQPQHFPEIVDESGRPLVGPEMEAVLGIVTQFAQLAQLARIRRAVEREQFQGKIHTAAVPVTDRRQRLDFVEDEPYTPLISAFIINDGPNTAKIAINEPYKWLEIKTNEDRSIDHSRAERKIERIYHECDSGETASLRIEAHY